MALDSCEKRGPRWSSSTVANRNDAVVTATPTRPPKYLHKIEDVYALVEVISTIPTIQTYVWEQCPTSAGYAHVTLFQMHCRIPTLKNSIVLYYPKKQVTSASRLCKQWLPCIQQYFHQQVGPTELGQVVLHKGAVSAPLESRTYSDSTENFIIIKSTLCCGLIPVDLAG